MQLFLKTPPLQEPLTLEETRAYLRLSSDQEEEHLASLIASARAYVETATGRALLKQKWLMQIKPPYPRFSPLIKREGKTLEIAFPRPPLLEVESVKTREKEVDYTVEDHKLRLSPTLWNQNLSITYWSGYGETSSALPPDLKMAVLMAVRCLYDHQKLDVPLLKPFKVLHLI